MAQVNNIYTQIYGVDFDDDIKSCGADENRKQSIMKRRAYLEHIYRKNRKIIDDDPPIYGMPVEINRVLQDSINRDTIHGPAPQSIETKLLLMVIAEWERDQETIRKIDAEKQEELRKAQQYEQSIIQEAMRRIEECKRRDKELAEKREFERRVHDKMVELLKHS